MLHLAICCQVEVGIIVFNQLLAELICLHSSPHVQTFRGIFTSYYSLVTCKTLWHAQRLYNANECTLTFHIAKHRFCILQPVLHIAYRSCYIETTRKAHLHELHTSPVSDSLRLTMQQGRCRSVARAPRSGLGFASLHMTASVNAVLDQCKRHK